jgi:hypothetical protein
MKCVAKVRVILPFVVIITSIFSPKVFAHKGIDVNETSSRNAHADAFEWNESRRLTWDDFRGNLDANEPDNTAAATYCGIGFEAKPAGKGNRLSIKVFNTFFPYQSWVREGEEKESILAHEQGHFDLCELYTRILKARLDEANDRGQNSEASLERIYHQLQAEYNQRQERYEMETEHGLITGAQQYWQKMIGQELSQTKMYALRK